MNLQQTSSLLQNKKDVINYERGKEFEEYVRKLFGDKFKMARWRKPQVISPDTFINDIRYPDLELIFRGIQNYKFAVECKYRQSFYNGTITWANRKQINVYEEFQNRFSIPVFIAIGVGGTPSAPRWLFVTPLCNLIQHETVHESKLIPYKRKPTNKFFYDTVQLRLW
jgi:hypothetical protein